MNDLISRQAVLDYIDNMPSELTADGRRMIRRIRLTEYIQDSLPSAQPDVPDTNVGDMISRQAAIDAIGKKADGIYKTKQNGATYPHNDFFQGMAYAEDVVKQLPSAEPKWIPVECKPPKERNRYWICTDTGYQCECRWTNNVYGLGDSDEWGWSIFDVPQYTKVVAYMPLPEPYERSKDERIHKD